VKPIGQIETPARRYARVKLHAFHDRSGLPRRSLASGAGRTKAWPDRNGCYFGKRVEGPAVFRDRWLASARTRLGVGALHQRVGRVKHHALGPFVMRVWIRILIERNVVL
jgi:hypothetical protein